MKMIQHFNGKEDPLCQGEGEEEFRPVHVRWDGSYVQSRATQHNNHVIWKYAHNTDTIREQTHKILSTIYK